MTRQTERQMRLFRERLRELCEGQQGIIAERAGLSRGQLNRIINGHCMPELSTVLDLATVLAVPVEELFSTDQVAAS